MFEVFIPVVLILVVPLIPIVVLFNIIEASDAPIVVMLVPVVLILVGPVIVVVEEAEPIVVGVEPIVLISTVP